MLVDGLFAQLWTSAALFVCCLKIYLKCKRRLDSQLLDYYQEHEKPTHKDRTYRHYWDLRDGDFWFMQNIIDVCSTKAFIWNLKI